MGEEEGREENWGRVQRELVWEGMAGKGKDEGCKRRGLCLVG